MKKLCVICYKKNTRKTNLTGIYSGLDGSRTRVQKPIPGPSTSVVCNLTFPPHGSYKQDTCFSSFMIRPLPQSFGNVVSYRVEVWVLKCRCSKSDCSN